MLETFLVVTWACFPCKFVRQATNRRAATEHAILRTYLVERCPDVVIVFPYLFDDNHPFAPPLSLVVLVWYGMVPLISARETAPLVINGVD